MKLASMFFTASAVYLRFYIKDTTNFVLCKINSDKQAALTFAFNTQKPYLCGLQQRQDGITKRIHRAYDGAVR